MNCSQISDYAVIGVLEAEDTENFYWAKNCVALLIWRQLKIEPIALREQISVLAPKIKKKNKKQKKW